MTTSKQCLLLTITMIAWLSIGEKDANAQSQPQEDCHIKIGWGDWPPYQFTENGEPKGIQIDLIKQIGEAANCKLSFISQNFPDNQQGIRDGTIDMTFDTSVTEEREKFALFSSPYRNEVLALYVRPKYMEACKSQPVAALIESGMRLGITRGNIYGETIRSIQSTPELNSKLIYRDDNTEHYKLFAENQLDAFVDDPAVMAFMIRNNPKTGPLKVCKIAVSSSPVSLMFSKKTVTQATVERFNSAIARVKQTPEYIKNWAW
ncbi:amino acid ABC transporter substrate-binding protein [Aliikangiella marina]|uniref:Amino acid ABC transporter substrate-binding protein n=1 Tax=Aliikangiella marina TaxID=1712262 RepID=A0A545TIB2_9GAMM|nr:transporter substrate-binding domain-containing protein [Aliikangiella marina]TQV76916.1 amino acid ABC transporter substrate-binding protein [Aliikangiella marina]